MSLNILKAQNFEQMALNGAINLKAYSQVVNDLNVFPIADGDTGDNMYMTISSGVNAIKGKGFATIGDVADKLSRGMLMGARGNSGVILSQIFYGIAEGFRGLESANVEQVGNAFRLGVKRAYEAVVKPTEGTILTVIREATEFACLNINEKSTIESFMRDLVVEMDNSLERTPELLYVLKEAGVVDSGGKGLLYIVQGMCKALNGESLHSESVVDNSANESKTVDLDKFDENSVMKFGYCTEFLLRLQTSKIELSLFSLEDFREGLEDLGDSIVAFQNGTIVKVHIHTMTPEVVLAHCHQFGEFLTLKIENMTLQHNESIFATDDTYESVFTKEHNKPYLSALSKQDKVQDRKKFGTITVATGEGICKTFKELGADVVIDGGQGKNPSTEDFIKAFDVVDAETIFVLPNNSNIIMTAKQAGELYADSNIVVVESKNIGEGYACLSMLCYDSQNVNEILSTFNDAMVGVETGMVSKAVRDAMIDNVEIKKDEYVGIKNKTMLASNSSKVEVACELLEKMQICKREFLIVIYGNECLENEKQEFKNCIKSKYNNLEIFEINGGQDVYDFILVLE